MVRHKVYIPEDIQIHHIQNTQIHNHTIHHQKAEEVVMVVEAAEAAEP
jgi:hypothetical protein